MACLALSCFLVVVWLAALPEGSGPSIAAVEREQLMAARGLYDVGDGMGAGLLWVYDEPTPIVGYGLGWSRRDGDSVGVDEFKGEAENKKEEGEEKKERSTREMPEGASPDWPVARKEDAAAEPRLAPGDQPAFDDKGGDNGGDEKEDGKDDGRDEPEEDGPRPTPSGHRVQVSGPAQTSASPSRMFLARDGLNAAIALSPTTALSPTPSFAMIKRAASSPSPSSSTFSSPPFADQPSAQETDGSDDGTVNDGSSSPAPVPTSVSAVGPQKRDRRRSRYRKGGH